MVNSGTMGSARHTCVQFGIYEVDLDEGELRKAGIRIKVQQQPFKVLRVLLEHPGQLVTREQLHDRIWPGASFGDFDQAVNVAVAKLRIALGDSADNPRFIETVPRRGYRFIAPVHSEGGAHSILSPASVNGDELRLPVLSAVRPRSSIGKRATLGLAIAIGIIAVAVAAILFRPTQTPYVFHESRMAKVRSVPHASALTGAALFTVRPGTANPCSCSGPKPRVLSHANIHCRTLTFSTCHRRENWPY